jgi:hypothetical protein
MQPLASRVAQQFGLSASPVQGIDLRYLTLWGGVEKEARHCGS